MALPISSTHGREGPTRIVEKAGLDPERFLADAAAGRPSQGQANRPARIGRPAANEAAMVKDAIMNIHGIHANQPAAI